MTALLRAASVALAALLFALPVIGETVRVPLRKVLDGDTIRVLFQGRNVRVRLLGIDTPESKINQKLYRDSSRSGVSSSVLLAEGIDAASHLRDLLAGEKEVDLEFGPRRYDMYERLLAWVYRTDGLMLNERMVLDGYASMMLYGGEERYEDRLRAALWSAQRKRLGIWGR